MYGEPQTPEALFKAVVEGIQEGFKGCATDFDFQVEYICDYASREPRQRTGYVVEGR
jgi:hypothetical protein